MANRQVPGGSPPKPNLSRRGEAGIVEGRLKRGKARGGHPGGAITARWPRQARRRGRPAGGHHEKRGLAGVGACQGGGEAVDQHEAIPCHPTAIRPEESRLREVEREQGARRLDRGGADRQVPEHLAPEIGAGIDADRRRPCFVLAMAGRTAAKRAATESRIGATL
jgi:hypothetical protein